MFDRVACLIGGIGLLWIGYEIFVKGGYYIKGVYSDFKGFNVPAGIIFIIFGLILIVYSVYMIWKMADKK